MIIASFGCCHSFHKKIKVPTADIGICTGDVCNKGNRIQFFNFINWYSKQHQIKTKILISGNHDYDLFYNEKIIKKYCLKLGIHILNSESINVKGVKIYGTPEMSRDNPAIFNNTPKQLEVKLQSLPEDLDVFISHQPPLGILDFYKNHVGSPEILNIIESKKPKLHFFSHIHEGFGSYETEFTKFFNVSIYNDKQDHLNPVTIVNI